MNLFGWLIKDEKVVCGLGGVYLMVMVFCLRDMLFIVGFVLVLLLFVSIVVFMYGSGSKLLRLEMVLVVFVVNFLFVVIGVVLVVMGVFICGLYLLV